MLVLGRNVGEYVVINENIFVRVVKQNGDLKLAIDAPKDIKIAGGPQVWRGKNLYFQVSNTGFGYGFLVFARAGALYTRELENIIFMNEPGGGIRPRQFREVLSWEW